MYDYHRIIRRERGEEVRSARRSGENCVTLDQRSLSRVPRDSTNAQTVARRRESLIASRSTGGAVRGTTGPGIVSVFAGLCAVGICSERNLRFCAIGCLVWLHRIDLFFAFILVPMNLALITLWFWQRSADRKFLATSDRLIFDDDSRDSFRQGRNPRWR